MFYRHDLYINGVNMRTGYGVTVADGEISKILALPRFKSASIKTIDWHEHTGLEADLSDPVFEPLFFTIRLQRTDGGSISEVADDALTPGHYFSMMFTNINLQFYRCRLSDVRNRSSLGRIESADFIIVCDDDIHAMLYDMLTAGGDEYIPASTNVPEPQMRIGISGPSQWQYFDELGIRVLRGWKKALTTPYLAKAPLVRNISDVEASIFDDDTVSVHGSRDNISLQLLLHCCDGYKQHGPDDFWRRYLCLLYWLTKPGEVRLEENISGLSYNSCYFDSMTVNEYVPSYPAPWIKFTVNMKPLN